MTDIEGYFINLETSNERCRNIRNHLNSLKKGEYYTRFPAVRGDKDEAARRGLREGELGLWESWLQLLRRIMSKEINRDFIHIIEDDARLSESFFETLSYLKKMSGRFDILATDMYVNPSIYMALSQQHNLLKKENKFAMSIDIYTGCTSSMLIPKEKIGLVYQKLKSTFNKEEKLLPIDNTLRRLAASKILTIGRIAPFTTTVSLDETQKSTIQENSKKEDAVIQTQKFCTLLRKKLSVVEDNYKIEDLIKPCVELSKYKACNEDEDFINHLYTVITKDAERYGLFKYAYSPNLIGEPDNPQS